MKTTRASGWTTRCFLAALALMAFGLKGSAGQWYPLRNQAPAGVEMLFLLSDGTVMAAKETGGSTVWNGWYRLKPDIHGSYVNGTWSTLPSMHYTRYDFESVMLADGRVFVAGGEYGTGIGTAEVYDPVSNLWTNLPIPTSLLNPNDASPEIGENQGFYDCDAKLLPNGKVLIAPDGAINTGGTLLFNPTNNTWAQGPVFAKVGYPDQSEATWVTLADGSILTVDPNSTTSERYIPSGNRWIHDGNLPVELYDSIGGEIGPGFLLPDGRAIFFGGTGHTAIYQPSGGTLEGFWSAGPDIPNGLTTPDAPAAMMSSGKILLSVSPAIYNDTNNNAVYPSPTSFFEYDPVTNAFNSVNGPTGATYDAAPYYTKMLALPDGSILYSTGGSSQLYLYRPSGEPLAAGKPTIDTIAANANGSYHLTGTLLNGVSAGAAYGDDAQMDSNYPIVRMTNSTGLVYYGRTFKWSSTGVMTGTNMVSTEFTLPPGLPSGVYSLVVVANGISSDPVKFVNMPPAPTIANITLTNADVTLTASNLLTGISYSVLGNDALGVSATNWAPLLTNIVATNVTVTLTVTNAAASAQPAKFFILSSP